jgi:hypothetical protein
MSRPADMSLLTELSSFSPVWSINIQAPTEPKLLLSLMSNSRKIKERSQEGGFPPALCFLTILLFFAVWH